MTPRERLAEARENGIRLNAIVGRIMGRPGHRTPDQEVFVSLIREEGYLDRSTAVPRTHRDTHGRVLDPYDPIAIALSEGRRQLALLLTEIADNPIEEEPKKPDIIKQ